MSDEVLEKILAEGRTRKQIVHPQLHRILVSPEWEVHAAVYGDINDDDATIFQACASILDHVRYRGRVDELVLRFRRVSQ